MPTSAQAGAEQTIWSAVLPLQEFPAIATPVCTENVIRVDEVRESPRLTR